MVIIRFSADTYPVRTHDFFIRNTPENQVLEIWVETIGIIRIAGTFPYGPESLFTQAVEFFHCIRDPVRLSKINAVVSVFEENPVFGCQHLVCNQIGIDGIDNGSRETCVHGFRCLPKTFGLKGVSAVAQIFSEFGNAVFTDFFRTDGLSDTDFYMRTFFVEHFVNEPHGA